jgi:predicted Rossmann fold flavoprotein
VPLKTEEDGRLFPLSDQSETIVQCLIQEAEKAGVRVSAGADISSLSKTEDKGPFGPEGFVLSFSKGDTVSCRKILLATGSGRQAYGWAKSMGHRIVPPVPSLFTFTIPGDPRLKDLAGISVPQGRVMVAGTKLAQTGPLLITHWGLSGPAVLKLSAWGARNFSEIGYKAHLEISWLADRNPETIAQDLRNLKAEHPKKLIATRAGFGLPQRLWERLTTAAGFGPERRWADATAHELAALTRELSAGVYQMEGKSTFKEEFVTCGGVDLDEINFKTMESRLSPGLYFAGEILDIDGVTGGFNFQSAWTTGWLAGKAMAAALS